MLLTERWYQNQIEEALLGGENLPPRARVDLEVEVVQKFGRVRHVQRQRVFEADEVTGVRAGEAVLQIWVGLAVVLRVGEVLDVVRDEPEGVRGIGQLSGGDGAVGLDEHGVGDAVFGVVERRLLGQAALHNSLQRLVGTATVRPAARSSWTSVNRLTTNCSISGPRTATSSSSAMSSSLRSLRPCSAKAARTVRTWARVLAERLAMTCPRLRSYSSTTTCGTSNSTWPCCTSVRTAAIIRSPWMSLAVSSQTEVSTSRRNTSSEVTRGVPWGR
jgi:hypothetical protein